MVPCGVYRGKGITILRKKNKWQRIGGRENCYCTVAHAVRTTVLLQSWSPFSSSLLSLWPRKLHLSRLTWASLFITSVSKFHMFAVWLKKFKNQKYIHSCLYMSLYMTWVFLSPGSVDRCTRVIFTCACVKIKRNFFFSIGGFFFPPPHLHADFCLFTS